MWQLIDEKAKCKNKLVNNFLKACADGLRHAQTGLRHAQTGIRHAQTGIRHAQTGAKARRRLENQNNEACFMELLKKYPNKHWRNK